MAFLSVLCSIAAAIIFIYAVNVQMERGQMKARAAAEAEGRELEKGRDDRMDRYGVWYLAGLITALALIGVGIATCQGNPAAIVFLAISGIVIFAGA